MQKGSTDWSAEVEMGNIYVIAWLTTSSGDLLAELKSLHKKNLSVYQETTESGQMVSQSFHGSADYICLTWDVTVPDTYAMSHLAHTSINAGEAAEHASIITDISNACMEMIKWRLECGTTKPYFWGDARASPGFHYATPLHPPPSRFVTFRWDPPTLERYVFMQWPLMWNKFPPYRAYIFSYYLMSSCLGDLPPGRHVSMGPTHPRAWRIYAMTSNVE